MKMDHPALALVDEKPTKFGGRLYTARRTPGINPPRWAVFGAVGFGPVGYLEAVQDARQSNSWLLLVLDAANRPIGKPDEPTGRKDTRMVHSYLNALHYFDARERGLA